MYYLIYKTTNNINGNIYVGMHETSNINDGYLGSGKRLLSSIKKYGKESFTREILFSFDNRRDMLEKEAEIVNEDFLKRNDVYNLTSGGKGGFYYINNSGIAKFKGRRHTEETKRKIAEFRKGKPTTAGRAPWNKGKKNCYSPEVYLKKCESLKKSREMRGRNSVVECCPSKSEVVGSNPIVRSNS